MSAIRTVTLLSVCGAALLARPAAAQTRFETLAALPGTNPIGLTSGAGLVYGAAAYLTPTADFNCGAFLQLKPPASPGELWDLTTIYTLDNTGSGGCIPAAAPIPGSGGGLYGTTTYGGVYGDGALYELQPPTTPGEAWTESVLYSFNLEGGLSGGTGLPLSAPVPGPNGSFYCGVAGGAYGYGALVQLLPPTVPGGPWTEAVLSSFPYALAPNTLLTGPGGVLYGTDYAGPIVQLNPPAAAGGAWTETVLYTLTRSDGLSPNSVILAGDGTLFGVTYDTNYDYGSGRATVFQLTPPASAGASWSFSLLHDFGDGLNLNSPLILRNGSLYGTVDSPTGGQVFELQPPLTAGGDWTLVHLHEFTGDQLPGGALVLDENGQIFGVTAAAYLQPPGGTVYRLATK